MYHSSALVWSHMFSGEFGIGAAYQATTFHRLCFVFGTGGMNIVMHRRTIENEEAIPLLQVPSPSPSSLHQVSLLLAARIVHEVVLEVAAVVRCCLHAGESQPGWTGQDGVRTQKGGGSTHSLEGADPGTGQGVEMPPCVGAPCKVGICGSLACELDYPYL